MVITAERRGVLPNRDRVANEYAIRVYFNQKFSAFTDEYGIEATNARKKLTELFVVRYYNSIICYTCGYDASFFFLLTTCERFPVYVAYSICS